VKSFWSKAAVVVGVWTLLALILATTNALVRATLGLPSQFWSMLGSSLVDYWIWAALTPVIFYLAKKFPFSRKNWPAMVAVHFVFYLLLTLAHEAIAALLRVNAGMPATYKGSPFLFRFVTSLYNDLWMYWPAVVVWSMLEYYQRYRERDMRAAQLKQQLAQAELQALRSQLHPHFLFNTLNSVTSLMHEDVRAADDMLGDLSRLLRVYLSSHNEQEIVLRREIELLETYTRIQKRRFEDRLSSSIDVPDDLLDAAIPALLLQPLVENAILHGIAPRPFPGTVSVSARRRGDALYLEVADNGQGLATNFIERIGLSNTRSRLQQLYGNQHTFTIAGGETRGTTVSISIPLHFLPATQDLETHDHSHVDRGRRTAGAPADPVAAEGR
jgi:signal transduction histidine kinase